jgi:hypothetical protein
MEDIMLNSIFGAYGQAALTGQGIYQTSPSQNMFNNSIGNQMNSSLAQQQLGNYYNAAMMQNKPRWMIDGVQYMTAKEVSKVLFPDDLESQLMFALKYGEE